MCQACLSLSRRRLLLGAMAVGVAASTPAFADNAGANAQNAISGEEALKRLLEGNARYVANNPQERDYSSGRAARAKAQYPIAALLSCSDSRVAPELIFDQGPGDLFVVRNAGNIVEPSGLASLEYAAHTLGVPLIIVLGHSTCGAVGAAIKEMKENAVLPGRLPDLVAAIRPAVEATKDAADPLSAAIAENVRLGAAHLRDNDPVITPIVHDRNIKVVGGTYDIATGQVALLT